MRARKAFPAFDFLKAFVNTLPMVYDTCSGHKKFTFQLPGKCDKGLKCNEMDVI